MKKTNNIFCKNSLLDIKKYNKKYLYPYGKKEIDASQNMILADGFYKGLDIHRAFSNNNMLIIGNAAERNKNFLEPNLLQCNSSFITVDTDGKLYNKHSQFLKEAGYIVKKIDFNDVENSACYNIFEYIDSEIDIYTIVDILVNERYEYDGDQFHNRDKYQTLLSALFLYVWKTYPKEEQLFSRVIALLQKGLSGLDQLYERLKENPEMKLCNQLYNTFKLLCVYGAVATSIIVDLLKDFEIYKAIHTQSIMNSDTLNLKDCIGKKHAIFFVNSSAHNCYSDIATVLYNQYGKLIAEYNSKINKVNAKRHSFLYVNNHIKYNKVFKNMPPALHYYGVDYVLMVDSVEAIKYECKEKFREYICCFDTWLLLNLRDKNTVDLVFEYVNHGKGQEGIDIAFLLLKDKVFSQGQDKCLCCVQCESKRVIFLGDKFSNQN